MISPHKLMIYLQNPDFFRGWIRRNRGNLDRVINVFQDTLLIYAAKNCRKRGYLDVIAKLVDAGANLHARDMYDRNALQWCAILVNTTSCENGVSLLVELGATPESCEHQIRIYVLGLIGKQISFRTFCIFLWHRAASMSVSRKRSEIMNAINYSQGTVVVRLLLESDVAINPGDMWSVTRTYFSDMSQNVVERSFMIDILIYTF